MAKANPKSRAPKQERYLTISTATYDTPYDEQERSIEFDRCRETRRARTVPFLRLKGQWLEEAGFKSSDQVRVEVNEGRLVITHK